jgi:hypothetical protein
MDNSTWDAAGGGGGEQDERTVKTAINMANRVRPRRMKSPFGGGDGTILCAEGGKYLQKPLQGGGICGTMKGNMIP